MMYLVFLVVSLVPSSGGCLCGVSEGLAVCGRIGTRIAGGQEALVSEFPWAALLVILTGGAPLRCGGTLVTDR